MSNTKLFKKLESDFPQIPKEEIKKMVDVIAESMKNALVEGENIEIRGFGSMKISRSKRGNSVIFKDFNKKPIDE